MYTIFVKFFYSQTALLSIHPRSESAMVKTNPNPNPIRNPILNVATVKRTFLHDNVDYQYAVNCSKLIAVNLHGK